MVCKVDEAGAFSKFWKKEAKTGIDEIKVPPMAALPT